MGQVIAVGIFLTPAGMAKSLGSPFWLLVVWLTIGVMSLCGAWCYGELAARFPEPGGGYVYLRRAFGPGIAFLYGWKCLLVMDPGLTAALAVGLASYAGYLVPLSPWGGKLVALSAIAVLAAGHVAGLRVGAGLMRWLTALKLGALAAIALLALGTGAGDWGNLAPFFGQRPGSDPLPGALAPGLVGAFFAFGGWWEVSKLAGEVRDPASVIPRALGLGTIIVTVVYLVTSLVFVYLVPPERVTSGETFAAQAGEILFGPAGARVFAGMVVVSILGSLAGFIMALPRLYYAMARDGLFFHAVAAVHPQFGTPARAIALQAVVASLLVILGTFNQIVAYFIFATVAFIALTVAGVVVLRRRTADAPAFRMPGYPFPVGIFLALAGILLLVLAARNPVQAFSGVGVVALGVPVYLAWVRPRPGVRTPAAE